MQYSCANVDNTEDSPITEWYMKMFGVIPFRNAENPEENDYIKAGFDKDLEEPSLIMDARSVNNEPVRDPLFGYASEIGKKQLFLREFRKIASTSVGRTLLYRLLIEIRRKKGDIGCAESDEYTNLYKLQLECDRNKNRSLQIRHSYLTMFAAASAIYFSDQKDQNIATVICKKFNDDYFEIENLLDGLDVGIFHEMIHWYHMLRNIIRYTEESRNIGENTNPFDEDPIGHFPTCLRYWTSLSELKQDNNYVFPHFDEIRTILDPLDTAHNGYLFGDDLSENLYRKCVGYILRYGHGCIGFHEKSIVIYRVMHSCQHYFNDYM